MTDAQPPTVSSTGSTNTTSTNTTPPPTRIGSAERQQAMDALDVHMSAGRLDPDEYGDRVGRASVARTTADLEPLFADLPLPHAGAAATMATSGPAPRSTTSAPAPSWSPPVSRPASPSRQRFNGREPLGGRIGEVAVAASPVIALILFLATKNFWDEAWIFFLLIPLLGAVVYGRDWHDNDHRGRDRRRNR